MAIDTREQSAFDFRGIKGDAKDAVTIRGEKKTPTLLVPVENKTLKTGDYSIVGHEDRIAIERKSMEDLFNCVGGDRKRFEKQLLRLNELEFPSVVVEASWDQVLKGCPHSKLSPKSVHRSVIAWQQKQEFSRIHWWFCQSKQFAQGTTFQILRYYMKGREQ